MDVCTSFRKGWNRYGVLWARILVVTTLFVASHSLAFILFYPVLNFYRFFGRKLMPCSFGMRATASPALSVGLGLLCVHDLEPNDLLDDSDILGF